MVFESKIGVHSRAEKIIIDNTGVLSKQAIVVQIKAETGLTVGRTTVHYHQNRLGLI